MRELKYILITDGSSDNILKSVIDWTLDTNYSMLPIKGYWIDFRLIPKKVNTISEKLELAKKLYQFDVIFYHRDAETTDIKILEQRKREIWEGINDPETIKRTICVIPIKMMESWLLFDTDAIKKAAGNRNYKGYLELPNIKSIEKEKQPKDLLHQLLKTASGLKGRNLNKFNPHVATHLVADNITDFSPLRRLRAFQVFEQDLKTVINDFLKLEEL